LPLGNPLPGPQAGSDFAGANIYSIVSGMYPILGDNIETDVSQGRDIRQYVDHAPDIYSVNSEPRKPYLQGNHIFFTSVRGEYGDISPQTEKDLINDAATQFPPNVAQMTEDAQMLLMGRLETQTSIMQTTINKSGKSMEEMQVFGTQTVGDREVPIMESSPFKGHMGAQRFDFFDPITGRHMNVTQGVFGEIEGDHGVYGELGRSMNRRITQIKAAYDEGQITESEKYSAIVAEGLNYFRDRASNVWNPLIRRARNTMELELKQQKITPTMAGKQKMMRELIGFEGVAYDGVMNLQTGVTNFANDAARVMLKQHMGNPAAMYNSGVLETYPIGPYTFGHFGPFMMRPPTNPDAYTYRVSEIDGIWTQNYWASTPSISTTFSEADAERQTRLAAASWVTKAHDSNARVASVGAATISGINDNFTNAGRLRPEINLINASKQYSDRINEMIRSMQQMGADMPPEIEAILESQQNRYTMQGGQTHLGGRPIWAGPYIGIVSQAYTSGAPIGN
tara:strand:- start:1711 stop:3240 length:1530 start_codon:yes stop_codon:yes gene_type:complete